MDYADAVFQIILYGGNARSSAMEAIRFAKQGDIASARTALRQAATEMQQAHQVQTSLIQQEARGEKTEPTLLMIHAQDHLMNAITVKELAEEFVDVYERLLAKEV